MGELGQCQQCGAQQYPVGQYQSLQYQAQLWQSVLGWMLVVIIALGLVSELWKSFKGAIFG